MSHDSTRASPTAIGAVFTVIFVIAIGFLASHKPHDDAVQRADASVKRAKAALAEIKEHERQIEESKLPTAWEHTVAADPMSNGKVSTSAANSVNVVEFAFPYTGAQQAKLSFRRHPRFGRDVILSIPRGQFLCTIGCSVLIRFDNGKAKRYSAYGPNDYSSTSIFVQGYDGIRHQAEKSKRIFIEAPIYQEGNPRFEFSTEKLI